MRREDRKFVDEVARLLANDEGDVVRPALDPTPCGICGCVIGEGLMTLHIAACHLNGRSE